MIYQNSVAAPRQELTDVVMESVTTDDMFIGLKVLPPAPLKLPTGHYPKITIAKGDTMRATAKKRTPGSKFDRWQSAIDDGTLTLVQVSEELQIPDEQSLVYEDYFAFEQVYAKECTNRLQRSVELDVAATIFNVTTGYFDATNGAVAYTAANIATMTPVADILAAIRVVKARGERPNTLIFPGPVYDRVRTCTDMRNFVAGSVNPGARVTGGTIQMAFDSHGITQVLIADGYVNQSEPGKATDLNLIWPTTYVGVMSCKEGQLLSGGVGRTFFWEKEGPLFNIQSYRDETVKSNVIRSLKTALEGLTNTRAGTLIGTQYS
jgi:hypothetical protein